MGARQVLRIAVAAAVLVVALLLSARPAGALELPVVVDGPRLVVRAEAGLERQARRAATQAAKDLQRIEADLEGAPRLDRVEIRLVKHMQDIAAAAPAGLGAPVWAAGTAYPGQGVVVVAYRGRQGEMLDAEKTLTHELAHLVLDRALGRGRVPRWLTEGFAYLHSSDVSTARYATLLGASIGGKLMRLWELEYAFPAREDEADLAYAQSYDFVAFLAHRGKWQELRRFLRELAGGAALDDAAQTAFGRRLVDLEKEWLESVRDRYFFLPFAMGGAAVWALGAVLLVLGWWRRRRMGRATLRRWAEEEAATSAPPTAAATPSASGASGSPAAARSPSGEPPEPR